MGILLRECALFCNDKDVWMQPTYTDKSVQSVLTNVYLAEMVSQWTLIKSTYVFI